MRCPSGTVLAWPVRGSVCVHIHRTVTLVITCNRAYPAGSLAVMIDEELAPIWRKLDLPAGGQWSQTVVRL